MITSRSWIRSFVRSTPAGALLLAMGCVQSPSSDRAAVEDIDALLASPTHVTLRSDGKWLDHHASLHVGDGWTLGLRLIGISELSKQRLVERPEFAAEIAVDLSEIHTFVGNAGNESFGVPRSEVGSYLTDPTTEFQCGARKLVGVVAVETATGDGLDAMIGLEIGLPETQQPGVVQEALLAHPEDTCRDEGWVFVSCEGSCYQSPNFGFARVCGVGGSWPSRYCYCRNGTPYASLSLERE